MSSLFHRRTRSASAQRPRTPVSTNAHMAATQAFLASRVSQGNLSASAAATALRTMSPPPTQVSDVQTKRMQRRSSSASLSNAPRGRGRGGLERRDSSGSMTERTFRSSPSPSRPVSHAGPEVAPPVPKIPSNITKPPPIPAKSQRRTASLEAPPARVASPVMNRAGGRGQSAQPVSPRSPQTNAAALVMKQQRPAELERTESRNSINFSYPRPQSPPIRSPASPPPQSPPLRNGISAAEAQRVQYDVAQVAQQPVKKKKKKVSPQTSEGSHLATGTVVSKQVSTASDPGPAASPQSQEQPIKKKKKKTPAAATGQTSHFPPSPVSTQESDSDVTPEKFRRQDRASGALNKQPSVVREDWEGEQEQEHAMTEAQRREQQGLSPASDVGRTIQGKKTLPAANMSRKIEEPASPTPLEPLMPSYHAVTQPRPGQPVQNKLLYVEEPHQRVASLSPSRSTRFSDRLASDLASGQKHEPLPRSVSPAKSALKQHSPSGLDSSFPRARGPSATPSDASDSNMSADGSARRRKSARVSFQPEVEIAGTAAEPVDTDSPTVFSPQHKEQGKKGLFGRSKPVLTTIPSQEEIDEHMKPRPQLPSFGSVRNRTHRTESSESIETPRAGATPQLLPSANIASSTSTSSDASSSSAYQASDEGVSSDHAIGSVFARHAQTQAQNVAPATRNSNLPLPPEVTSVEGSGDVSDTESDTSVEDNHAANASRSANHVADTKPVRTAPVSSNAMLNAPAEAPAVPSVAVQPPTPGLEQGNPSDQWAIEVPGGFPASTDSLPRPAAPNTIEESAGLGIAESPSAPTVTSEPELQTLGDSDTEASDYDSIYSDAEEDLTNLEGDGFMSIDAVVESPIVETPRPRVVSPPASPLTERPPGGARTTSWDEAQQRWSGIAQQTRQATVVQPNQPAQQVSIYANVDEGSQPAWQMPVQSFEQGRQQSAQEKPMRSVEQKRRQPAQQPPMQSVIEERPQATQHVPDQPHLVEEPQPRKKKKTAAAIAAASAPAARRAPPPGAPPKIRKQASADPMVDATNRTSGSFRPSMRGQPAPPQNENPALRSSMRSQPAALPDSGFKKSMRAPAAPTAPVAKSRTKPVSQAAPPPPAQPRAALQKKHIPPATRAPTPAPAKQAAKPFSNDSDSESSFRKSRRSKSTSGGGFSMRRSMRAAPEAPSQPAGRGAVRSLSPPQRRPFSPPPEQKTLRSSMRTSMDNPGPSLRSPPVEKRSSSLFGTSRPAKDPMPGQPRPPATGLRSRAADSDDEEEEEEETPRKKTFRSRINDSSDEEDDDKGALRPVRGIPRRHDESDSTDLEDSSDEEPKKKKAPPPPKINTAVTASPASAAPLSPNTMKKKGLFSRFRSKKEKDDSSKYRPAVGSTGERNTILAQTAPAVQAAKKDDVGPKRSPDDDNDDAANGAGFENMGFGSAAERDAMIAQTMARLEAAKGGGSQQPSNQQQDPVSGSVSGSAPDSSTPSSPAAGRLQRRVTPQRFASDSWPLPPKVGALDEEQRPRTADALGKTNGLPGRPGVGHRNPTSETLRTEGGTPIVGRTGKKKRFPMLRKAFGLKD